MNNEILKIYNNIQSKHIKKTTKSIYHYTSPEGLKGILDSKSLYATDLFYLNDASEGQYALDLLKKNIDEFCVGMPDIRSYIIKEITDVEKNIWKSLIHTYSISFSLKQDSLNMWNYYTKGKSIEGYNLEFNTSKLINDIQIEIIDREGKIAMRDSEEHLKLHHGKVVYLISKQKEIIADVFKIFISEYHKNFEDESLDIMAYLIVQKIYYYGRFFKKPCFKIEEEYRLIFSTYLIESEYSLKKGIPYRELFRVKNGLMIPYQKCLFKSKDISGLTCSPGSPEDITRSSILRLLGQEYSHISEEKVMFSSVPLRY